MSPPRKAAAQSAWEMVTGFKTKQYSGSTVYSAHPGHSESSGRSPATSSPTDKVTDAPTVREGGEGY